MSNLVYRWLEADEVVKIGDIDRSERIRVGYAYENGQLRKMDVNWDAPAWFVEGDGDFTVASEIAFCREHLARNGRLYGAFSNEKLVGIGLLQPEIEPNVAQLAFLHVSREHRQEGIGRRIFAVLLDEAKKLGATQMYVSATPSESAIGFYLSQGFVPTDTLIPVLFELEPEDIHLRKNL